MCLGDGCDNGTSILKDIFHNNVVRIILGELIIVLLMWRLGFKVTYAPELEDDWVAIGAIGEWVGTAIIPFVVLYLQHKWDSNKNAIALSNLVTSDQLNEFEQKFAPLLTETNKKINDKLSDVKPNISLRERQLLQFLAISMGANIQEIALRMGLSIPTTQRLLQKMKENGKIQVYGTSKGRIYKAVYVPEEFKSEEQ